MVAARQKQTSGQSYPVTTSSRNCLFPQPSGIIPKKFYA
jgi:hypothetical protein